MARPLRIEFAGALNHVTARGDGREDIYSGDEDRHLFLDVLGRVCTRFHWVVHAYCLMGIRFVADGKGQPSPWGELKHQLFLGSEAFTEAMRAKVPRGRDYREVLQARPRPVAKPIRDYAREHADRDSAIASGGHTMKDIGDYFGLHYSRVSKIVGKGEIAKGKT